MKRLPTLRIVACLFVLFLSAAIPFALGQGTYQTINYPGAQSTNALGINSAGEVVGCYDGGGYLYSNGIYTTINYPGAQSTCWWGINDVGQIVGLKSDIFHDVGLVYDRATQTFTEFPDYPGADIGTWGGHINNAGVIVGAAMRESSNHATTLYEGFELTNGTYTRITPGSNAYLTCINNQGAAIGSTILGSEIQKTFIYSNGTFMVIDPGPLHRRANCMNDSGTIVGGIMEGGFGWVYQNGVMTRLIVPGSNGNYATDVNDFGIVVGFYGNQYGTESGFIWTPPAAAEK